ncbi:MAG: hypothetical protein J7M18_00735 [Candidatus Eremiobacteraeota bacterium]|nr:hypothetical protein [Candidatus Eremiobacteraeota bacterium]
MESEEPGEAVSTLTGEDSIFEELFPGEIFERFSFLVHDQENVKTVTTKKIIKN